MQPSERAPSDVPPPAIPPPPVAPPPQLQGWQRLHPISPVLNGLSTAVRVWPVFLVAVLNGNNRWIIAGLLAVAAIVLFSVETVRYLRFDYRLEGTTLVVRSGLLVRRTRTVPADRVQQVSRKEKLRHRLFGVAEVAVEVAGAGSEPDVKLSAVTTAEAERIRVRLQDARRSVGATPPAPDRVVYEQPNGALIKWAAISSPLFMLPVIGAGVSALGEAVELERAWSWLPDGSQLLFAALVGAVGLGAATAFNVVRYYETRLVQADDNLRLEYGLLTHRRLELPTDRVQAVVTKVSPAGRLSGTIGLTAHNASSAGDTPNSYLPAVPRSERERLLAWVIPDVAIEAPIEMHPKAALRRSVLRWFRPAALVAIAGWIAIRTWWAPWLLLLVVPAMMLGVRAWRVLGHAETPDVVLSRRGAISEHTTAVRKSRTQSATVAANWFQRRAGLASLQIEVAQPLGRVVIRDMAAHEAYLIADELTSGVYRSEAAESHRDKDAEEQESLEP